MLYGVCAVCKRQTGNSGLLFIGDDRICRPCVREELIAARTATADARAAGYAEGRRDGIEIAANLIDQPTIMDGRAAARFIRGLLISDDTPAATPKEPTP